MNERTTTAAAGAGCLWAVFASLYGFYVGPIALIGLLPAIPLLVRGRDPRVLQLSVVLGIIGTLLGIATFAGSTRVGDDPGLAAFVIVPIAATVFATVGLLQRRRD
jgi:hypothetical protein